MDELAGWTAKQLSFWMAGKLHEMSGWLLEDWTMESLAEILKLDGLREELNTNLFEEFFKLFLKFVYLILFIVVDIDV